MFSQGGPIFRKGVHPVRLYGFILTVTQSNRVIIFAVHCDWNLRLSLRIGLYVFFFLFGDWKGLVK